MRTILIVTLLSWSCTACEPTTLPTSIDAATDVDASDPLDVGRPDVTTWPFCPSAWPPSPSIVYCGQRGGRDCYEMGGISLNNIPCRYDSGGVVLAPAGAECAACEMNLGPRDGAKL